MAGADPWPRIFSNLKIHSMSTDPYAPPTSNVERHDNAGRRHFEYVGFLPRLLAIIIDAILFFVVSFVIMFFILLMTEVGQADSEAPPTTSTFMLVLFYVGPVATTLWFWGKFGGTPGKLILGLRIVDNQTGKRASFWRHLGRYVSYMLSSIPVFLGYYWVLVDKDKRAWHDHLSGTAVVRRSRSQR